MNDCCFNEISRNKSINSNIESEYICYCNKVTEQDIKMQYYQIIVKQ